MPASAPKEIVIQIPHLKLSAKRWHAGKKPKILAIHGWLDNANSFDPLAEELLDFDIVAIDMPGHGLSEHMPPNFVYHFVDTVAVVLSVMQSLEWPSCHLMGHSMGGGIISMVAAVKPEMVESIALIDAIGALSDVPEATTERLKNHLRQRQRVEQKKLPEYNSIQDAIAARQRAMAMTDASAKLIADRGLKETSKGKFTWRSDPGLTVSSAQRFTEEQVQDFLKNITCPTLLVRADPGLGFSPELFKARGALVKNFTYHPVKGLHHVHMDASAEVGTHLRKFWSSLSAR